MIRQVRWCVWQADNLFVYEEFGKRMDGYEAVRRIFKSKAKGS